MEQPKEYGILCQRAREIAARQQESSKIDTVGKKDPLFLKNLVFALCGHHNYKKTS